MRIAFEYFASAITFLTPLLAVEWMIAYHRKCDGNWRRSTIGKHLMAFMGAVALVFTLNGVQLAIILLQESTPYWFFVLRAVTFLTFPGVIIWQRVLLYRAFKEEEGGE